MNTQKPNIVVMGGGTGTFVSLSGLRDYPVNLTAIVTMMDDGGSSGRLRDQLGVLPPGDLRQCLVALSEDATIWRKLFTYRFESGDLEGHNFGNIMLSALEKVTSTYEEALEQAHTIMDVKGRVLPVTHEQARLTAHYETGRVVHGETLLDEEGVDGSRIKNLTLDRPVHITQSAKDALLGADCIVIGPGDLYSSIIVLALVDGVREAIVQSQARLVYVSNLMTKSSQTYGYAVSDHVADIAKYFGRCPDVVVANSAEIPEEVAAYYRLSRDIPVKNDMKSDEKTRVMEADVLSNMTHIAQDGVHSASQAHSILRHDSAKLAHILHIICMG